MTEYLAHQITPDPLDEHCVALYLEVLGEKVVLFQALFEHYEGIGTVRTLDIRRSLVCVLTTPDMVSHCTALLESIRDIVPWRAVPRPPEAEGERFLGYFRKGM